MSPGAAASRPGRRSGFANYAELVDRRAAARRASLNTLIFAVCAVAGQMLFGFTLALLCCRVTKGRVIYRTIFILPILIPGIVIGAIWKLLLNFDFGMVNQLTGSSASKP